MVFHYFQNLLNPNNLSYEGDSQIKSLMAEGFSQKEAENLVWLQNHRNRGKYYGIATGLFTVYTCRLTLSQYMKANFPKLYYTPVLGFAAQAALVYSCYLAFDYLYTSNRYASNNKWTNHTVFSNRVYQDSREALIQNFEPLNRKFSSAEVEQFQERCDNLSETKGDRKYIYNPYLHGEDEEAWKAQINFLYEEKQRASELYTVRKQIQEENKDKTANGEELVYEPFNTIKYVDKTGLTHQLFQFFLFNRWQPIF